MLPQKLICKDYSVRPRSALPFGATWTSATALSETPAAPWNSSCSTSRAEYVPAGADTAVNGQAKCLCRFRRQRAEVRAGRARFVGQPAALQHVRNADELQEIAPPAFRLMRRIGPFAGRRALRAGERAGSPVGQEIGQVEYVAGTRSAFRQNCALAKSSSAPAFRAT